MTAKHLVAGIGFRRGTPADAIVALLRRALTETGGGALGAIGTAADRAADPAIREAAAAFGLVPLAVEAEALMGADSRVPTRSSLIERLRGVGSLAEATALAIVGDSGHLVLARIDDGQATCALAAMGDTQACARPFPPPEAGEGGPRVKSGAGSAGSGEVATLSRPSSTRGPPSPASGGEKRASSTSEHPDPARQFERVAKAQIATP